VTRRKPQETLHTRAPAYIVRDAHFRLILDLYDASHRRATPHPALTDRANPSVPEHVDRIAAAVPPGRERFTSDWRDIMFAYFLEKLGQWIERAEEQRRHDYLAQASDIADVEQRMRRIERNGYSF